MLLLAPNPLFGILESSHLLLQTLYWEWTETLQPDHGHICYLVLLNVLGKGVIVTPRDQDHCLHLLRSLDGRVADHGLEGGARGDLGQGACSSWKPEQGLGGNDYQGFPPRPHLVVKRLKRLGLVVKLTICRLNRWKYWAPVVGCTTSQLTMSVSPYTSLLSVICRNLSNLHWKRQQVNQHLRHLHELCSGPAPSMPCGSKMVKPLCKPHFDSPFATYVSSMI